ncbi:MAG: hypothetical protein PF518_07980 [Spirochaetaceae bacterium]|jgi:hypothetical protein|nr:hypothetical protein [Spirochaetaceae bacterium]
MMIGDKVTLSYAGQEKLRSRRFPAEIGSMYSNIARARATILAIEKEIVQIKLLNNGYPGNIAGSKGIWISRESIEVCHD